MRKTAITLGLVGAIGAGTYTAIPKEPYVIQYDGGGRLDEYYQTYSALRQSGRPVRIDGMCMSACTMVAGLIPLERVCVTPYAVLAFHSAYRVSMFGAEHSSEGTRMIWQTYPEAIRKILIENGWNGDPSDHRTAPQGNKHPEMIYIRTPELYSIFRPCK
jgi:hypothetical protein